MTDRIVPTARRLKVLGLAVVGLCATTAQAVSPVTLSYAVNNQWQGGYCAVVKVTNPNNEAVDWSGSLVVSGAVQNVWNAVWTQSGSSLLLRGDGWNKTLAPHATAESIGFCANGTPAHAPAPAPAPAPAWQSIAKEGQTFTVNGTQTVRYGSGSTWIQKSVTGTGYCTNGYFQRDPLVGVPKQCQVAQGTPTPPPTTSLRWRGVSLAGAEFGPGNLPGVPGTHYIYPEASSVAYFKGKGMNTVRLPFLWERLQPSLNQTFDTAELARLTNFVRQVTATGVTVILDPHNYARYRGNLVGSAAVPVSAFADFWRRLALEFKGNDKVVFGLMNEPHGMPTEQWLLGANAALASIRAAGATNVVTVPGNAWSGAHSWTQSWYGLSNATVMKGVSDPGKNLVFEVHQYLDGDSSGTSPTCVSADIGPQRLAEFTAWARSQGYRAVLGEMGAASNDTCNQAVHNTLAYLEANTDVWVGWTWWAAGPWWGSYMYSIEPNGTQDKPQMTVLQRHLP